MVSIDIPSNLPEAASSSGGIPLLDPITLAFGFIMVTIIIFGIWYLWENSGMRNLNIENNRLRIRRFGDKDIRENAIHHATEAYALATQPIQFVTKFGSIVPGYITDKRYGITLNVAYPDKVQEYPSPESLKEGVNTMLARELQTYHAPKDPGAMFGFMAIGGILGLMAGFVAAGMV